MPKAPSSRDKEINRLFSSLKENADEAQEQGRLCLQLVWKISRNDEIRATIDVSNTGRGIL